MKKFVNSLKKAHLELRLLIALLPARPGGVQELHHQVLISSFWRICHKLLRIDLTWLRYEFSFLSDFLMEFEKLVYDKYGGPHPLQGLLFTLSQTDKADVQEILRLGATRTVEVIAPAVEKKRRALVLRFWTDFMDEP